MFKIINTKNYIARNSIEYAIERQRSLIRGDKSKIQESIAKLNDPEIEDDVLGLRLGISSLQFWTNALEKDKATLDNLLRISTFD